MFPALPHVCSTWCEGECANRFCWLISNAFRICFYFKHSKNASINQRNNRFIAGFHNEGEPCEVEYPTSQMEFIHLFQRPAVLAIITNL